MAWKEIRGSRRVNDGLRTITYTITFQGLLADTKPALGNHIGDIQSGATALSSTGLTGEPEAVQVGQITKTTQIYQEVTVSFVGTYTA